MGDVLHRLVGPVALGNTATTVYTAPAGSVVTVRSVHVTNEAAAQHTFRLSVGADAAGKRFFYDTPVAAADPGFDWSGVLVLDAGEILQAYADTAGALTLTISGVVTTP